MSAWTVDTINPIETFNLPPADKNRRSLGGGRRRGTFFPRLSVTADSPSDWRGKQHLGAHPLQFSSIHFPAAVWLHVQEEGNEKKPFILYLFCFL